jgi:uncharacterized protein
MRRLLLALALIAAPGLLAPAAAVAQTDRAVLAAALQPLADKGNGEALYHLGMMRQLGIGGDKDPAAAFDLFKRSAEAGDPLGSYEYGDYFAKGDSVYVTADPTEALKYKLIAAEAGYALAQYDVARLFFDRDDKDNALEWLTRSAQQGHADALRALASLHNSDAIPKDGARTYAYYTLYLHRLAAPTEKQTGWLTTFAASLTPEDVERGKKIVDDWKIDVSPLTAKAASGLRAGVALVTPPVLAKSKVKSKAALKPNK